MPDRRDTDMEGIKYVPERLHPQGRGLTTQCLGKYHILL
jgi:hypothetical protein